MFEWILEIYIGKNLCKKYKLDIPEVKIGRAAENHINLPAEVVSRNHALISIAKGYIVLEDLGSTNGTYYKDKKIDRIYLKEGDFFVIGPYGFKVLKSSFDEAQPVSEIVLRKTTECSKTGTIDKEVKEKIIKQMEELEDTQITNIED
ncbi:MAG: FHA domain-containing protein [Thermoanaerobaculia bacterium]